MCKIISEEEHGFNKGQVIIEDSDSDDAFQVFSSTLHLFCIYGFSMQSYPDKNMNCFPSFSNSIKLTFNVFSAQDCV